MSVKGGCCCSALTTPFTVEFEPPQYILQVVSKLSKEESVDKLSDALDKLLEGIRALVTLFCRRYSVTIPPDWVSQSQAQINAITHFK